MREQLARASSSGDLESIDGRLGDVERIAAMAFGPRLGSLLIRYRDGGQERWRREAILLVAHRVARKVRTNSDLSVKIATQALNEWDMPHCKTCGGSRELMAGDVRVICQSCNGVGVHRYSDSDRQSAIGGWGGKISRGFDVAMVTISSAVASSVSTARAQLGY